MKILRLDKDYGACLCAHRKRKGVPHMKRSFSHLILLLINSAALTVGTASLTMMLSAPKTASAHGFAGSRFFPATLSTDDLFVADEFSLPTVSSILTRH